ncbi:MAG: hypothetical protein AB7O97_12160 [Planctomycetota bacterium]
MRPRTLASCVLAALVMGGAWSALGGTPKVLRADPPTVDQDSDGDFLPDVIEWACMTSAANGDTDTDAIGDFVEVVQRGHPRDPSMPLPQDHELRVVVTTTDTPYGSEVHMHLLFRFMGAMDLLTNLNVWAEVAAAPGLRISLAEIAVQPISLHQRLVPGEGLWVRVSVPLVSEQVLRWVLPCSIGADAVIGSRQLRTAVPIFDRGGVTCSIVPYSDSLYAVQSIGALTALEGSGVNRVCVMQLAPLGGGPGGSAFEVVAAECQDCNDLVCGPDCSSSIGTVILLPGGVGSITGG